MSNKLVVMFDFDDPFGPLDIPNALIFNNEHDMQEYFNSKDFFLWPTAGIEEAAKGHTISDFNSKGMQISGEGVLLKGITTRYIKDYHGNTFCMKCFWAKTF